jgi:predicted ArsR family transcriptional regulator
VTTYRALAGRSRQALLAALVEAGRPMDAGEAAAAVGLHRNTARVQLDMLSSADLVTRTAERRGGRGRPHVVYELTPAAGGALAAEEAQAGSASYRELARMLASQLSELADVHEAAIRAGRRWAAALDEQPLPVEPVSAADAAAVLTGVLARLGFAPEPDLDGGQILLHRCPFAEVARENRAIICGIHLGMLTATAERIDSPLDVTGLDPFVNDDPLLCVVRLATRPRA